MQKHEPDSVARLQGAMKDGSNTSMPVPVIQSDTCPVVECGDKHKVGGGLCIASGVQEKFLIERDFRS